MLKLLARQTGWLLAIFILLAGCSQETTKLNSDRIRETFGNYGVEILRADATYRLSSLYSGEGDDKTCRTLAIVEFHQPMAPQLAAAHKRIAAGGSIGEVFRADGWSIRKTNTNIMDAVPPDVGLDIAALMATALPPALATHVYQFVVEKAGSQYTYATITEVHHPEYLTTRGLRAIYAETQD